MGDNATMPTDLVDSPDEDHALTLLAELGEQVEEVGGAEEGSLSSLVRPLLQLLGDLSGLEAVYLTSIDWEAGEQVVEIARNTATEDGFEVTEGAVVPWQETLCQLALGQGGGWNVEVPTTWGRERPTAVDMGIQSFVWRTRSHTRPRAPRSASFSARMR